MIISQCAKWAMVQEFKDGSRMYTVSVWLTDTDHYETKEALIGLHCYAVCDEVKRNTCKILYK